MRLSATFPLLQRMSPPSVPALFGARTTVPVTAQAQRQPAASVAAPVAALAPSKDFDDLDLDQRVRLIGEW